MRYMKLFVLGLAVLTANAFSSYAGNVVPGTVIHHIPSKAQRYVGSPSLCVLPDGTYLASHDEFGPKSTEFKSAVTRVYRSEDKGKTWNMLSQIDGQFWSTLFVLEGDVYIIGTNKHHGNFIIRRSSDGGKTWTVPCDSRTGLVLEGEFHTAPVPLVVHKGRIWRALEYATSNTTKWGERYSAMVISAPVGADLLDRKSWRVSEKLPRNASLLDGNFQAYLEGNAVVTPEGRLVDILRVNTYKRSEEVAAMIGVSSNGKRLSDDVRFINMPGAAKKFTIRYDSRTGMYFSIVNVDDGTHPELNPSRVRNNLVLIASEDLMNWRICRELLYDKDVEKHGFQYVDWQFDGEDIIFVSRTAADEKDGSAHNNHDANYLTFHRIENYAYGCASR